MNVETIKQLVGHAAGKFVPVLGAVHVYATPAGNRAQVGNGRYVVDVPTDIEPLTVNADRFAAAVTACGNETPKITTTDTHITVKAGRVRARIQRITAEYPRAEPEPRNTVPLPDVGAVLKTLSRFCATDASRAWAAAVCLHGGYGYATNNVVLCRLPLARPVDKMLNVPSPVIEAIVERGEVVDMGYAENSVTFYYADDSWVRTQLIAGAWPTEVVDGYVRELEGGAWLEVNAALPGMLLTAERMSEDRTPVVSFTGHGIKLQDDSFEADDLDPVPESGNVSARMAALVLAVADGVQWHTPKPNFHGFKSGELVGILGGVR